MFVFRLRRPPPLLLWMAVRLEKGRYLLLCQILRVENPGSLGPTNNNGRKSNREGRNTRLCLRNFPVTTWVTYVSWIFFAFKDGAYFCHCAYVLHISRYSGFLWVVPSNTGIFLRGLKLCGENRTWQVLLVSIKFTLSQLSGGQKPKSSLNVQRNLENTRNPATQFQAWVHSVANTPNFPLLFDIIQLLTIARNSFEGQLWRSTRGLAAYAAHLSRLILHLVESSDLVIMIRQTFDWQIRGLMVRG